MWPRSITAFGWHRTTGATNIARATRQANRRSHDPITAVTSSSPTGELPPPSRTAAWTGVERVNPGSRPVDGGTEHVAEANLQVFIDEVTERGLGLADEPQRNSAADADSRLRYQAELTRELVMAAMLRLTRTPP
jgi:hypothetical protein